jgi:hypothetical protein
MSTTIPSRLDETPEQPDSAGVARGGDAGAGIQPARRTRSTRACTTAHDLGLPGGLCSRARMACTTAQAPRPSQNRSQKCMAGMAPRPLS